MTDNVQLASLMAQFKTVSDKLAALELGQKDQSAQFLNILKTTRELDKITSNLPEALRTDENITRIMETFGKPVDMSTAQFITLKDHYLDEAKKAGIAEGIKQAEIEREALLTGGGSNSPGGKKGTFHFGNKPLEAVTQGLVDQIKEI